MKDYQEFIICEDLKYPAIYHDDVILYSQTKLSDDEIRGNKQESPFKRYVDFWFLAVCVGALQDQLPNFSPTDFHKFHDGSILVRDSWRIDLLAILAIGYTGNCEIINRPKEVIGLANMLAAAGIPVLLEMLKDEIDMPVGSAPIWNLSRRLNIFLTEVDGS